MSCEQERADIARAFVESIVDVLVAKALRALDQTGLRTLVVAGGVGANAQLRERLENGTSGARGSGVFSAARSVYRQRRDDCVSGIGKAQTHPRSSVKGMRLAFGASALVA